MLLQVINDMEQMYIQIRYNDNVQKLYKYYKNKKYLVLFAKQYAGLISNMKSIALLVENEYIEDALTIFRKYLETYFIIMSLYVHTELVEEYMIHDKYISRKACKKELNLVRDFCEGKPQGFLEYGYIERYINAEHDFRYSTKIVAEMGNVLDFHQWYKMCNNFVHNNLTSASVNLIDAKKAIIQASVKTSNYINEKIRSVIFS